MKKFFRKLMALVMVATIGITTSGTVIAKAGTDVPVYYMDVSVAKNFIYQLDIDDYTYSSRIFTPAAGECVAMQIIGLSDHDIFITVYSDITGFEYTVRLSIKDGETWTIRPNLTSSVYFLFENIGDTAAVARFVVFSD